MEEYTEFNIGEMRGGYRADEDGITLWKGNYLTREAESRLSWEEARFLVNSYMEDGVYLLPGETAERIETAGMYQQLDLFSMFTEQAGNLAMKQAETVTPIRSETKIPPEQIADILRSGGGRDNSRKRIYTKYQQGKTPEEMAAFLQKEYGTTGKGFEFDGKQIAVWFNEDGMRVGYGTSTERPVLQMNWQEVEAKIRSQVVNGTYMGANEAYLTDEAERDRIAGHLFFFFRDGMEEIPEELELKAGNYPDAHAHMVELLSTKEGVEMVASHMDHALHQLETGEKKLRFRSIISKDELRAELDNLLIEKQIFPTADHVEIKREDFITQDEIDNRLGRGSGFSHGSFRIYDYFKEGHDSKEAETFLKKEYGIGGSSHALAGADHSWEDHNFKGIELKKGNICEPYAKVLLSWKVVEKRIRKLVAEDKYLSPAGKEAYARYKEEEAQKALEKAQAVIERKTKVACKEAIERTISEKFDGYRLPKDTPDAVILKYGSERVSYVLANTVMHLTHDGRFSPDNKAWAKEIEPYAKHENRDLIVSSHPAVLNGFINQTRRYMEQELAAKQITIDGQLCMKVDEWEADGAAFLMGNSVEDKNFFYASVNGNYHYEYDYMPDREEVEDDYINSVAMEDIDRHEAEVFSRIEGTEDVAETESRFSVEETSDAIEPGQDTSGHDVQKSEAESAIEKPVKQPAPKVDKSNAINFHITDDALGAGSAKEKFRRNIEAIRTLEKVESENRIATLEEQQILSQYVGWGGLADAFDESKSAWAGEYQQLKELLSPQEYASARESTLNAHYTSPAIIRSIYDTLERMGFEKGNVLEPAMGIGNFFGMLPEKMQESRLYGVELDGITGRIARQLYPKADIKISGFEKTDYPNDFFDVAVGNVPFGQYKVADKQYDKNNFLIHDYFFAKTLDKVRPGGVVAFVTSKGTMDKKSPEVRKYLAQRAELMGAVRLPNTAFKENAGTEVTSDILFFKKRDRVMDIEPDWVHLSEDANGIAMNTYFAEHPEMIIGKMEMVSGPYGMESTCQPDATRPFAEQLREAVSRIDGEIEAVEMDELADELADATIPADPDVKNYSYTLVEDKVYYRENSIMKPVDMSESMQERIKGMVGIRNCTQELINLQLEEYPDTVIKEKQRELNTLMIRSAENMV